MVDNLFQCFTFPPTQHTFSSKLNPLSFGAQKLVCFITCVGLIETDLFFSAHLLFSALVGVFGGFLGCRLYRLGVFTIGECLGLVS